MKHWTLLTPLRFVRALLRALVLPGTALAILVFGALGALVPISIVRTLGGSELGGVQAMAGIIGGAVGILAAYVLGDHLNSRIQRLRAPIGSASIGADGVRWRHLGTTQFVSWKSVRDLEPRRAEIILHVVEGKEIALLVGEAEAFVAAARAALARYREGESPEAITSLEFTGGSVAEWIGRARSALQGPSYRAADIGEDHCVRVAIDPRAPAAQRIASAAALSNASDDARKRVRVAIEETADPVVANALEDALDARDDEAALRKAIERS